MIGVGRTVFEGTRIDEFKVEVIGVLENAVGPRQSLILARLTGGPLANTGVIAGMSGSPVYLDGKLVGAVSYGFPFSKETIGGITPIQEMIEATRTDAPRAVSARLVPPLGAGALRALDREAFAAALQRPLRVLSGEALRLPGSLAPPAPAWRRCRCPWSSRVLQTRLSTGRAGCSPAWVSRPSRACRARASRTPGPSSPPAARSACP
jgi:hypothetical protein